MYIHILMKVWDQMRGDYNMKKGPYRGAHVCVQQCKGRRADIRSEMDMHTCTDAYIHLEEGMGPDEG